MEKVAVVYPDLQDITVLVNNAQLDQLLTPFKPNVFVQLWISYSLFHRLPAQLAQPTLYQILIKADVFVVLGMSQKVVNVFPTVKILKFLMWFLENATVEMHSFEMDLEFVSQDVQALNNGTATSVFALLVSQNTQLAKPAHLTLYQTIKEQPVFVKTQIKSSTWISLLAFPAKPTPNLLVI